MWFDDDATTPVSLQLQLKIENDEASMTPAQKFIIGTSNYSHPAQARLLAIIPMLQPEAVDTKGVTLP
jgi:hypothetical protein